MPAAIAGIIRFFYRRMDKTRSIVKFNVQLSLLHSLSFSPYCSPSYAGNNFGFGEFRVNRRLIQLGNFKTDVLDFDKSVVPTSQKFRENGWYTDWKKGFEIVSIISLLN